MKLLADIKSIENLNKYNVDGYIVSSIEYSCHNDKCFNIDEIKYITEFGKQNKKLVIVNIDRIIEEEDLDDIKKYIDKLIEYDVDYFIYSDFSILRYMQSKKLTNRLIYDPKTMITN